jgi:hypothetical protein
MRINKKRTVHIFIIIVCVSAALFGCKPYAGDDMPSDVETAFETPKAKPVPKETETILGSEGMLKLADDISELEDYTDAIVIATVSEAKASPEIGENECITLTDIVIDEIIVNDGELQEGGTATVIEYYRTEPYPEDESIKRIISTNATLPLKTGGKYLLFLREAPAEQEYGEYAIAYGWQGKYPITQALRNKEIHEITARDLEWRKENEYAIGKDMEGKVTIMLAKQVIEKYIRR